ncbi:hypothetical protein YC2023_080407 [Brassica napus]
MVTGRYITTYNMPIMDNLSNEYSDFIIVGLSSASLVHNPIFHYVKIFLSASPIRQTGVSASVTQPSNLSLLVVVVRA